jgi:hypothetical protein
MNEEHPMKRAVIYLAAIFVLAGAAEAIAQDVAVVVNRSNPAEGISIVELRKVLLDRARWPDGKKITVVMTEADRPVALKAVCDMNQKDFTFHIMRATFSGGTVEPPTIVRSGGEVNQSVARGAGAIGFLSAKEVDESVKTLKVNGLAPGQPGYPVSAK